MDKKMHEFLRYCYEHKEGHYTKITKYEEIPVGKKPSEDEFELFLYELKDCNEISVTRSQRIINEKAMLNVEILHNGILAISDEKYLRRHKLRWREIKKTWVQTYIPIVTVLTTFLLIGISWLERRSTMSELKEVRQRLESLEYHKTNTEGDSSTGIESEILIFSDKSNGSLSVPREDSLEQMETESLIVEP